MTRQKRFKKIHAIPPDREHVMLLEAMAKSFSQLMPEHLRFTVVMFDAHARMAGYISNSGKPFGFAPSRRRPSFKQKYQRVFKVTP